MAVLPIRVVPDPVLRQKARRVRRIDDSIRKLIDDMIDTVLAAPGAGLAAPQVGVPIRVIVVDTIVVDTEEGEVKAIVNPEIVRKVGERWVTEGCLSVPDYRVEIKRAEKVVAKGRDRQGKEIRLKGEGHLAQALEHEIDHLDGVLCIDRVESPDKLFKVEPGKKAEMEGQ